MGATGVPFGRTEVLVPPPEPHERALARGKGPQGPGIMGFRKNGKWYIFVMYRVFHLFSFVAFFHEHISRTVVNLLGLGSYRFPVNTRIGF